MRWGLLVLVLGLVAGCELAGPDSVVDYDRVETIRYGRHVQPLLEAKCTACHGPRQAEAGLRLDTWAALVAGAEHGEAVVPFSPAHSRLLRLATEPAAPHPADVGAEPLTEAEVRFLRRWVEEGARNDAGTVPYSGPGPRLYVTNQDDASVSVVDAQALVVARVVDLQRLGFPATAKPHHVAVEADGRFWYVSLIGAGAVLKFNRENELVGRLDAFETPGLLALDPGGERLFVGRSMTAASPPRAVGIVRRSDMALLAEVPVFYPRPHALVAHPAGRYAYSASLVENQLAVVDGQDRVVSLLPLAGAPFVQGAASPDGRRLYLTSEMMAQVQVLGTANPAAPVAEGTIAVGRRPWHPVFTPDGRFLYVPNKDDASVSVIDVAGGSVAATITGAGLAQPHGSAARPDGRYVFVSNNNLNGRYAPRHALPGARPGTVVVIDTATRQVVKVLEVGANPTGVGLGG